MRPYANGTDTPKDGGKKKHSRRGKAANMVGGVKKTMTKAKVNAVKTGKRKLNKAEKDEVDGLLDLSRNEAALNGNGVTETPTLKVAATSSKTSVAKLNMKMEKIKSIVSVASKKNGFEPMPDSSTPTRRSTRISQRAGISAINGDHVNGESATNGESVSDVSVAEEAAEQNGTSNGSGGFLKKTISKIWKLPQDISAGVAYKEVATENGSVNGAASHDKMDQASKASCVIS